MANQMYEFFRNHIKMAMYGTRCEIWNHLGFSCPYDKEVKEEDKEVFTNLQKISSIIEDCINQIDAIVAPDTDTIKINEFDSFRIGLENATNNARGQIDEIMCSDVMRKRLFDIAMRRQEEQRRLETIQKMKDAVNPANLSGAPSDFGGADTVRIVKAEDGTEEVKPVTEG